MQIENLKVVNFVVKSKAFMPTKFSETVQGQQVPQVVMHWVNQLFRNVITLKNNLGKFVVCQDGILHSEGNYQNNIIH